MPKQSRSEHDEPSKPTNFLRKKLKLLNLDMDQINPIDLVVPENETYYLGSADPGLPEVKWITEVGHQLQAKSIREIKKWIGIPDKVARKIPRQPQLISNVFALSNLRPINPNAIGFTPEEYNPAYIAQSIRLSALEYVFGDSTRHEHMVEYIDRFIGQVGIWIPILRDMTVERNATLIIGTEGKTLLARNVYIKVGGLIDIHSDVFNFQCNSIQGNVA